MAKNIEKYLRNLVKEKENELYKFETKINEANEIQNDFFKIDEDGNLIELGENEKKIFSNMGLTHFEIKNDKGVIKCSMTFDSKKEFEFTLGIE